MHWERSIPRNLFRIARILVDRDKQLWLYLE